MERGCSPAHALRANKKTERAGVDNAEPTEQHHQATEIRELAILGRYENKKIFI